MNWLLDPNKMDVDNIRNIREVARKYFTTKRMNISKINFI